MPLFFRVICIPFIFMLCHIGSFAQSNKKTHVIVFGVDGMSPDGVRKANTPNMHRMMREGAYTLHARGVLPTSSSPNWASMIMGAGPEQHGVTSNSWERGDDGIAPAAKGDEGIFPTIFSVVRHGKPDAEIGVIHDWDGLARLVEATKVNHISHEEGPYKTAAAAEKYILEKRPDFLFLHFDNVDDAGHTYSHGSQSYYQAVGLVDSLLGVVVEATKKAGTYDNTIFLVTADHGGVGYGHGGETMAEIEIPFILYGKSIKKGYEIKRTVFTYDNAATVAFVWKLSTPTAWIGRPITSAFVGNPDDKADATEHYTLDPPVIVSSAAAGEPTGGLFIDSIPKVICITDERYKTYYTTDGTEPTARSMPYTIPFTVTKTTVVKFKSFDNAGSESPTANGYFRVLRKDQLHPMKYGYYEIEEPEALPDFKHMEPMRIGSCNEFALSEIPTRGTNFALVLGGYINIEQDGDYKFFTMSDDGSKLYIDDKQIVNNDGSHGVKQHGGDVTLTKGYHVLKVSYFNGSGGKVLNVFYRGPGIPKQPVPVDVLFGEKR